LANGDFGATYLEGPGNDYTVRWPLFIAKADFLSGSGPRHLFQPLQRERALLVVAPHLELARGDQHQRHTR